MSIKMFLLLLSLSALANADVKTVALVQSINLKTADKSDITCSSIKQIFIESSQVTSKNCMGEITASEKDQGMWIIIEMDPVIPKDKKIEWRIEYGSGNLTSSFSVTDAVEKPLSATSQVEVTTKAKERATETNRVNVRRKRDASPASPAPPAASTSEEPHPTTTKKEEPTKKPEPPATTKSEPPGTTKAPAPPSANKINVTVNYIQFHSGQAPVYVNKHTQAVVVAVIEGLILGAILALFIFRCYRRSKMSAAGLYPPVSDYPPNSMRNTVYYDNGGSLNYQRNSRPEIPSYRTPDVQPAVRLDSLPPRPQQPTVTPNLVPVSTTSPSATITPAPLNYWPDQPGQGQSQPVRNIMDSDI